MNFKTATFFSFFLLFAILQSTISADVNTNSYPFDLLEPLVRISPARKHGVLGDEFGYSAVAHQIQKVSSTDSYLKALDSTVIMVGAPYGKFPGGLTGIPSSGLACSDEYLSYTEEQLLALPEENITECYKDLVPGLVYTCPLSNGGDCYATLGNNNATGPDGLLFDRVGNVKQPDPTTFSSDPVMVFQNKSGQLMGSLLYSTDEYFVACAPLWEYASTLHQGHSQPLGRCVYSTRNLTRFNILQPCIPETSNNQNLEGFCILGTGVHISPFQNETSIPILAAGSPARHKSSGGVFYFNNLTSQNPSENLIEGEFLDVYVPASHGDTPTRRKGYKNVDFEEPQTYYGFFITSGYITSTTRKNFIVSSPRWDTSIQTGRVFIIQVLNEIPNMYVEGEQFGEYFGNSAASLDLNGDGWDDLVVGAPMYSDPSAPNIGRIFIYMNNYGVLNKTSVIKGSTSFGQFGYAVDSIGDINDDGYEDFAVSAPFEGSGAVYIYYGQPRDSEDRIVNPQYAQCIDGSSFVNKVSNLTEVSMFGISVSGNKDIDNNQYKDLVIGAHGSQAVFILRSRPFVNVTVNAEINTGPVSLISYSCADMYGRPATCFAVSICATYDSPTLEGEFVTNYTLSEVINDDTQRLYLTNYSDYSITRQLKFTASDVEKCDNVTVYVLNSTLSLDFNNFKLVAEVQQISRQDEVVDTNFVPSDLSLYPRIVSDPAEVTVFVDSQCGQDNVCDLDLKLTYINSTYLGLDGEQFSEQRYLTLDAVTRVDVYLSYANIGEDVFGYLISFPLPRNIFIHRLVLPQSSFFTCNDTTPGNSTHANLVCNDQTPYLSKLFGDRVIYLRWLVNSSLQNLADIDRPVLVPITISPDPVDSRNRENTTADNNVLVDIDIRSRAKYRVETSFEQEGIKYQGNRSSVSVSSVSELGEENRLSVSIINDGPSTIYNAELTVHIPAKTNDGHYYYYPVDILYSSGNVECNKSSLNPDSISYNITSSNTRRRRSLRVTRGKPSIMSSLLTRQSRQDGSNDYDLDCSDNADLCLTVKCEVKDWEGLASIDIIGHLDERFYMGKSTTYNLRAYAMVGVVNSFINTTGSDNSNTADLVARPPAVQPDPRVEWYYIAPPAVGVVLIIIILGVILYFFGFFQRKKHSASDKEENTDEGVAQFIENPFGDKK